MHSLSESNETKKKSQETPISLSFPLDGISLSFVPKKDLIMANSVSFLQMSLLLSESLGNVLWCAFHFPQLLWLSGHTQAIKLLFSFLILDFSIKSVIKDSTKNLLVMVLEETFLSYFTPILQIGDNSYRLTQLGYP